MLLTIRQEIYLKFAGSIPIAMTQSSNVLLACCGNAYNITPEEFEHINPRTRLL